MKQSSLICGIAVLMAAFVFVSGAPIQKDALSVIYGRKSVRIFIGDPVSKADLEKILRAGMAAPTAMDMRPWNFVVITERNMLDKLADGLLYGKMLKKAGAAIIVCAVPGKAFNKQSEYAILDSTLAGENILLAAEALGIGAVWTAGYPLKEHMDFLRSTLNIPADIIPLNVIPIGKPRGIEEPKDKWNPENIHWGMW